jgi:hypothetical protein
MRTAFIASTAVAVLALAIPAFAGAPFLLTPFDIGFAKTLPWGNSRNSLGISEGYDIHRVVADTEALLGPSMPTLVRMETLRRAVVYASRDRKVADELVAFVIGRVTRLEAPGPPEPIALFDAGFVVEALNELQQFAAGSKVFWGVDRDIVGLTRPYDGRALLEQSAALRPNDTSIQFALALVVPQSQAEMYLRRARVGARDDALLANNLARLQLQ